MAERGNTTHGPNMDDQMKHETRGMTQGNRPSHVEEWRETEPFPDDTDAPEVWAATQGAGTKEPPQDGVSSRDSDEEP